MKFQIIYFVLISFIAIGSIVFFIRVTLGALSPGKGRFGVGARIKKRFAMGEVLSFGGLNIPVLVYQAVRFAILGIWLIGAVLLKITKGMPSFNLQLFLIVILISLIMVMVYG